MGRNLVGWENLFFWSGSLKLAYVEYASVQNYFVEVVAAQSCGQFRASCLVTRHAILDWISSTVCYWTEESCSTEYILNTLAEFIIVSRRRRSSSLRHSTTLPCYPRLPSSFARCWTSWIWGIMSPAMEVAISFLHIQSGQLQWLQILTSFACYLL